MIIDELSEKPGCEVIERSEYRETGEIGKSAKARDRGTKLCEEFIVIVFE